MKIQKLILYKTSLDREYQNVIDTDPEETLTKTKFKEQILDSFYSPLQIYDGSVKSIKENDGGMVISISNTYEDIMTEGYNYAAIYTGKKWIFYFIISMSSLNDGNKPSMLITLERDAWSNNIEYFTNHREDDKQQVVRCHQERIYGGGDNKFYPYFVPSNDVSSFTTKIYEQYLNLGGGGNVVWCGIRFSKDTIVEGNAGVALASALTTILGGVTGVVLDTVPDLVKSIIDKVENGTSLMESIRLTITDGSVLDDVLNTGGWKTIRDMALIGCSMYESGAPMFYFPCQIISGVQDGVPNLVNEFDCVINGTNYHYNFNNNVNVNKLFSFESEEVIETTLTLTPPFKYTVSGTQISVSTPVLASNKILRNSTGTKIIFPFADTADTTITYIVGGVITNEHLDYSFTYKSPMSGFTATDDIGSLYFDPYVEYNSVKEFDPRIYCAPYYRVFSCLGQAEVEIPIVMDRVNIQNKLLIGSKSVPSLSVFLNGQLISGYNSIGTMGGLPTSYDKWKDYILSSAVNMGSSILGFAGSPMNTSQTTRTIKKHGDKTVSGKVKNGVETITGFRQPGDVTTTDEVKKVSGGMSLDSAALGVARGVTSAVQDGFNIMSQATRPTVPSVIASNNIEKFIPKIVGEVFSDVKELNDLLGELYLYGYKYPEVQSVKKNCRVWFDYCETSMCSLPSIKNYRDREILENAFDRGVTKWHFGPFGLHSSFERNLNNVERKFISAEDAQISFDFTVQDGTALENRGTLGRINVDFLGNYTLTDRGLRATSSDFAIGLDIVSDNTWIPYNTMVFQIQDIANITDGRSISMYSEGTNRIRGPAAIMSNKKIFPGERINISNYYNKTIAISVGSTGAYGGEYRLYVDGELVDSGTGVYINTRLKNGYSYLWNGSGYNQLDFTISKFKFYYGLDHLWTEDEARQHLLSPI